MSERIVDVTQVPPARRHPAIFEAWEALPVGGVLKLIVDHDPKPLFYEFRAERGGEFRWDALERGPVRWSVDITRVAASSAGPITLEETVNAAAERHPAVREVLAHHGIDLCCGGVHPIAVAAQAHGVDAAALLAELNAATRKPAPTLEGAPAWAQGAPQHEVDVREDLGRGLEPFAKIMAAVGKVGPGEVLRLKAIFEPMPLYKVLALKGFEHWSRREGESDWAVWFHKKS